MPTSLKQIEAQVLALSMADRVKLAEAVLKSLRRPSPEARRKRWSEMMRQRLAAIERGDYSGCLEGDEFADIRRRSV
ncbi:MAG TPA: addiction module protein [Steroidobacter sp.]|uniref:addiction module protein n=1 Tax=Steroidobacter sp. TaxID=1978227 RepID=UPI002ED92EF2